MDLRHSKHETVTGKFFSLACDLLRFSWGGLWES